MQKGIDSFIRYIEEHGNFKQVKKMPGENKTLVQMQSEKNTIIVVFGKLMFVDVIRNIRKCNERELCMLNTKYPSVKVFIREGLEESKEAVARQYFERTMTNYELENMILDLISMFE